VQLTADQEKLKGDRNKAIIKIRESIQTITEKDKIITDLQELIKTYNDNKITDESSSNNNINDTTSLQNELEICKTELMVVRSSYMDVNKKYDELQISLKKRIDNVNMLEGKVTDLCNENEALKNVVSERDTQLASYDMHVSDLMEKVDRLSIESKQYKDLYDIAEYEREELLRKTETPSTFDVLLRCSDPQRDVTWCLIR
jgi:chromosome segregation ATPase